MSSSPLLQERLHESIDESNDQSSSVRNNLIGFFSTKTFHYAVLLLVALDVGCMFAGVCDL